MTLSLDDKKVLFYALSSELTGFSEFELYGTGVGDSYFAMLNEQAGNELVTAVLKNYQTLDKDTNDLKAHVAKLVDSHTFGPVMRSIIKMWYLGNWYPLYPENQGDATVVSSQAYVESLVWRVMGTHPMGAKQPGYATWSESLNKE